MKSLYSKIKNKFLIIGILTFLPFLTHAQDYVPISPGGVPFVGKSTDLEEVLVALFKAGVSIAAFLAVAMLIVGGIQYMGSDSIFAKDEGKKRISAALGGLLIALTCVLMLGIVFGFDGTSAGGSFKALGSK